MDRRSRIFVAGHRGLIGQALLRRLRADGYANVLTRPHATLDLTDRAQVERFFNRERPEVVLMAAGKVGGIEANRTAPAEFIRANLAMQTAVLDVAYRHGVGDLIFFGSGCMYPRACPPPMREEALLGGPLEPTSEAYAVAKLAGWKMCEAYNRQYGTRFITVIPASVYGPNDHFDLAGSHVLAALIRKFHDAKLAGTPVVVWGSGSPRREFVHVDDLVDACLLLTQIDSPPVVVNVGAGQDVSIKDLALMIKGILGLEAEITLDPSKPDGAPQKLLDSSAARRLGWSPKIPLEAGISQTYEWYRAHAAGDGPGERRPGPRGVERVREQKPAGDAVR